MAYFDCIVPFLDGRPLLNAVCIDEEKVDEGVAMIVDGDGLMRVVNVGGKLSIDKYGEGFPPEGSGLDVFECIVPFLDGSALLNAIGVDETEARVNADLVVEDSDDLVRLTFETGRVTVDMGLVAGKVAELNSADDIRKEGM